MGQNLQRPSGQHLAARSTRAPYRLDGPGLPPPATSDPIRGSGRLASRDKTGGGDYGTRNDIAVIWPPQRGPIVLAILTSRPNRDASLNDNDPLVAKPAKTTLDALQ